MKKCLHLMLLFWSFSCFAQQYSQLWSDVNYAGDGQGYHNLDIYLPETDKDSYPVVIYIYGSAWYSNNGKGADMSTVGAALLDAGFAVVTPNHRSSSDALFPAQIHDIKAVIRFVRGTSDQYNFDTSFVAISGSSSGGHLASLAGTTNGVEEHTIGSATMDIEGDLGAYTDMSSSVDAVVDWFGPVDFHRMEGCSTHNTGGSPEADIIGGPVEQNLDEAALLGPINYVDPSDPPFLIFHGQQDNVVPHCQSEFLHEALDEEGVESELVLMPDGQHGPGVNDVSENHQTMVDFLTGLLDSADPSEQLPFHETPHAIPGVIQAQDYDLGGEGVAYHEENTNGNEGNADYRPDDGVDIESAEDTDGEYNIAHTLDGEWLEYTVDVEQTADYDLEVRVAREGDNGEFHIEMDGEDVTGPIDVPNTGDWQAWETVTVNDVSLTEGEQVMRIAFDSDYTNINYVAFKDLVTGIESSSHSDGLMAYPNPFGSEGIQVTGRKLTGYTLFEANGKILEKGKVDPEKRIGKSLKPGVYFLRIESENQATKIFRISRSK